MPLGVMKTYYVDLEKDGLNAVLKRSVKRYGWRPTDAANVVWSPQRLTQTFSPLLQQVNEKHVLTIMYMSVMEWICMREGRPLTGLFPDATYSPILCVEVSQLKRKFAAMSKAS